MTLRTFTVTEASRSAAGLEAALRERGLANLAQHGKHTLAVIDLPLLIRLLHVVNQVSQIINRPGLTRMLEVTGLLSQSVAVMDGSWLENPSWPAQTLADIEAALRFGGSEDAG
jgi:hypothetical protein